MISPNNEKFRKKKGKSHWEKGKPETGIRKPEM
jgi:hypothetical protein